MFAGTERHNLARGIQRCNAAVLHRNLVGSKSLSPRFVATLIALQSSSGPDPSNDRALRPSLLNGYRLRVGVHRHSAGSVPEKFLLHFDIRAIRPQQRRVCDETMPSEAFVDTGLKCFGLDDISHNRLAPVRPLTVNCLAGEDPIVLGSIFCVAPPRSQRITEACVERNRLLRRLSFA